MFNTHISREVFTRMVDRSDRARSLGEATFYDPHTQ